MENPDLLWSLVKETFVASDFYCHTHGRWVDTNQGCDDDCNRVPVFMAAPRKSRPNRKDGSDWGRWVGR